MYHGIAVYRGEAMLRAFNGQIHIRGPQGFIKRLLEKPSTREVRSVELLRKR
jgi:hypothetical protein